MNSTDAFDILIAAFPLQGAKVDVTANPAYEFLGDFDFAAILVADDTVRLAATLDGLGADGPPALQRRLLEAGIMGVETGFGAMAPDPMGTGIIALIDTVALDGLDADDFKLRVVDFMLHVEYWRAEGVRRLLDDQAARDNDDDPRARSETMIRA